MNLPTEIGPWLHEQGYGQPTELIPLAGGCINNGARLITADDHSFFLKQNRAAPADMFAREAEGLAALANANGPRVPQAHLVGATFLLLEDLAPASPDTDYWSRFGQQLAAMHSQENKRFGFEHDNYLGSTPQPNPWTEDGYTFFAEHRLIFQSNLASNQGLLEPTDAQRVERIAARLPALVPKQPASLIHGDLWSGNAIADSKGQPAVIDPACHYGWAEAELGMTRLFGGFPQTFYQAYESARPLEAGWRDRLPLYNLYHLLNHLNLFGRSYLSQVQSILSRYSD